MATAETPAVPKEYRIPPEAYDRITWGKARWPVLFAGYYIPICAGLLLCDAIFNNNSEILIGTHSWLHDALYSLFFATGMTLFARGDRLGLAGLQIRNDSVVLYRGTPVDPIYRTGETVTVSDIFRVREISSDVWFLKRRGIVVKYGPRRFRWFGRKSFYVPARTGDYAEIKDLLFTLWSQQS